MNLRVHELKRGNISQFSIFSIICINEIITKEKLVTAVYLNQKRDISYENTYEHNN